MSNTSLIIGESGTGKSTSLRNLNPAETFIINVLDKPLPFSGYRKNYVKISADGMTGNYYASDDYFKIIKIINHINEKRPDIKNLILDDWQYTMCNEFMRRATETGFAKFTEIGQHAWSIIRTLTGCRHDLYNFVLSHSDSDNDGRKKCKTIGKMLDEKITIEGMFTVVLHTQVMDGNYKFLTQNDGAHIAKSPKGMFKDKYIDNDLAEILKQMIAYNHGDDVVESFLDDVEPDEMLPDVEGIVTPVIRTVPKNSQGLTKAAARMN
jgi:hypothetical protein